MEPTAGKEQHLGPTVSSHGSGKVYGVARWKHKQSYESWVRQPQLYLFYEHEYNI